MLLDLSENSRTLDARIREPQAVLSDPRMSRIVKFSSVRNRTASVRGMHKGTISTSSNRDLDGAIFLKESFNLPLQPHRLHTHLHTDVLISVQSAPSVERSVQSLLQENSNRKSKTALLYLFAIVSLTARFSRNKTSFVLAVKFTGNLRLTQRLFRKLKTPVTDSGRGQ